MRLWSVSVPTGMSMTCLRTNYRYVYDLSPYQLQICLWPVSVPTGDMSMTCLRTNYRYVYDLSPYQLQKCLWPLSVPTTDMSMTCLRTSYRCLRPVSVPTTDMSMTCLRNSYRYYLWFVPVSTTTRLAPVAHYSLPNPLPPPTQNIFMYIRPVLAASPQ